MAELKGTMGNDTTRTTAGEGRRGIGSDGRSGRTPRVAQPDEFFPLASEEMMRRGEVSDAIEHCRRGLIFYPENISGYAVLANAYLLLDEPTRAANVLRDGHRRTGAERLLELAELIEDEGKIQNSKFKIEEGERPLIPVEVGEVISPAGDLSHTDAEQSAAADAEDEGGDRAEKGLSFITDDPEGEGYVSRTPDDDEDLYPYGSDERDDEDYDEDLTERLIAGSDESLFGDEVRPTSRDLFTGEPLQNDRSFFQDDDEEEVRAEESSEFSIREGERVDLSSPVEDIIVPAPAPGSTIHEDPSEGVDQLIPMPERRAGTAETRGEEKGKKEEKKQKKKERKEEKEEKRREEEAKVIRPEDPTAGMAAGGDRKETGDLVDLIDEELDRMSEQGEQRETSGLSLHSGTQISDLRSRNLRLIPGLEYAPLRKDEGSMKIAPLVDERKGGGSWGLPPIGQPDPTPLSPDESDEESSVSTSGGGDSSPDERQDLTPLEELARRLETARIPAVEEEKEEDESPAFEPSLVSDTFAGILVSQGAYAEAIKAYQMLARLKPDRRDEYEKKIAEVRWKMDNVTGA